ncbi:MAG: CHAT domain-containing protein [Caldilineales bacterium]
MSIADLEIGLHRRDEGAYAVELRYNLPADAPENAAEINPITGDDVQISFDFEALRALKSQSDAYGKALSASLFTAPVAAAFAGARASAASAFSPLRLRLFIGPSAPELHNLAWETLQDPARPASLLSGENIIFSRYLSSEDWRPVTLRPKREQRALVVVANPNDLGDYNLAAVDVAGEVARATEALGQVSVSKLAGGGQASRNAILEELRSGYDVLYLVAHGKAGSGRPVVFLETPEGAADPVAGEQLVADINGLAARPALVVLASCQSAGAGEDASSRDEGALAALGPRLAGAGIPAVVGMQGNVSMETVKQFMPVFFRELQRDGVIDRALSVARGAIADRPDWWAPVLFMRLKSGRLWYSPGFGDRRVSMEKWPGLLANIESGRCTPIIGAGLLETLIGPRAEIAQRWSEIYHFPMAPHQRDDLAEVAQYLAVQQGELFPREELTRYMRGQMLHRLQQAGGAPDKGASLDELFTELGKGHWHDDSDEPHWVLANLPLPIFITTDPSSMMEEALRTAGKQPEVALCPWNDRMALTPNIFERDPDYEPTAERPLVYHLFGQVDVRWSYVLTEDDYFGYMLGMGANRELIPERVRRALVDSGLLFVGFRLDGWDFRVLFRSVLSQGGNERLNRPDYKHVAAQVDPEQSNTLEPDRARDYLKEYVQSADISVFWGSATDFLRELQSRWRERSGGGA